MLKKILFSLILLFPLVCFSQFKIDKTKNMKVTFNNSLYSYQLSFKTEDTSFVVYKNITYGFLYASDEYCVFSKSCGTGCAEYSVLILKPEIQWKYFDLPYYVDYEKHYFIKRNQDRNKLQAVDFLTGQIFWSRTLTKNPYGLYSRTLSANVSNNILQITFSNTDIDSANLITPYKPNKTYTFKLPIE